MSSFADIKIKWDGVEYTIPSNRVLKAIAIVEAHVTLKEIHDMLSVRQTFKLATLAEALAALLAWCGCPSSDPARKGQMINGDEVYLAMFGGAASGKPEASPEIVQVLMSLLAVMTPPSHLVRSAAMGGSATPGGKQQPPMQTPGGRRSKKHSRSRSASGDLSLQNSGT